MMCIWSPQNSELNIFLDGHNIEYMQNLNQNSIIAKYTLHIRTEYIQCFVKNSRIYYYMWHNSRIYYYPSSRHTSPSQWSLSARVRGRHRRGESHERRHSSTRRSIVVRLMPFLCAGACAVRPEDTMTTKGRPQMFMRLSDRYVVSHGRGRVLPHEQGYPTT